MGELGAALNILFNKVGDFFDIFDLSFFVSGSVCLGALLVGNRLGRLIDLSITGAYEAVAYLIASYVLGLMCFAGGRLMRPKNPAIFAARFKAAIEDHGLAAAYGGYFGGRAGDADRLYNRLWAEMRQNAALAPSFALVRRYWVMAAAYDGMALALVVWWGVLGYWATVSTSSLALRLPLLAVLPLAVLLCRREAGRLAWYQMDELAASIASFEHTLRPAADKPVEVVKFPASD
jgi:hypothetical protein